MSDTSVADRWLSRGFPVLALIAFSVVTSRQVDAQQPKVGYIFPPVVKAGTSTDVQLGGYDFTSDMQFFVHDARVKLEPLGGPGEFFVPEPPYWFGEKGFAAAFPIPREIAARIEVPADVPTGLVRWQVANANGVSPAGVLYISDADEVVESRIRDDQVQQLARLPIAVSGRIRKISEVDRYRIVVEKTGPITIDLMARRLGSNFTSIVEIRDSTGKLIEDVADTEGVDVQLTFAATAGESYEISLYDADFRGNRAYVYRLAIRDQPRVVASVPASITTDKPHDVEFVVDSGRQEYEIVRHSVSMPLAAEEGWGKGLPRDTSLRISDLPQLTEATAGATLQVPCSVTGRLGSDELQDRFAFAGTKGDIRRIRVEARSLGSPLDVSLDIVDANGKILAANDDLPGTPDAGLDFTVPADGDYACVISDMSGQPRSPASVYRLSLVELTPSFQLTTAQQVVVPIAGKAELAIKAVREAGFSGEVQLRVEGLPEGVTVPAELKIPEGKNDLKITLEAAEDAASTAAMIRVIGSATVNDQTMKRIATAPATGNLCPLTPASNHTSSILLATTMKPPLKLALIDKNRQRAVHRGTTYPAPFLIQRDEGFGGEVTLQMASSQGRHRQGIWGPIMTVPAGQTEALYPCFMPEWLATDRTTRMVVVAEAKVPDPKGNVRCLLAPADARITMILEGALLKLAHHAEDLTVRLGETFEVLLEISRSTKLQSEARITLDVPEPLRGKVVAEQVVAASEDSRLVLRIKTAAARELAGDWDVVVKATALQDGRWPVVSQTTIPVRFVAAAATAAVP